MPKLGWPWEMIERRVKSSRVLRYSEELMGMMMSPGRVGFGPPSPKSPWQGEQFFWNKALPHLEGCSRGGRQRVVDQSVELLRGQDITPDGHVHMGAALRDDLFCLADIGRRRDAFAMADGAVLLEEGGTVRYGGRLDDVARQDLHLLGGQAFTPGRHLQVLSALADDLAQLLRGAAKGHRASMAGAAVDHEQPLPVGRDQEVEQGRAFLRAHGRRPVGDGGVLVRRELHAVVERALELERIAGNEFGGLVALGTELGKEPAAAGRQDETCQGVDLVRAQVARPGGHALVLPLRDDGVQVGPDRDADAGSMTGGAIGGVERSRLVPLCDLRRGGASRRASTERITIDAPMKPVMPNTTGLPAKCLRDDRSRNGNARRPRMSSVGTMNAPMISSLPGKYLRNWNRKRKYHSGRGV